MLVITQPVPAALREQTERVEAGFRDYQELSYQRTALKAAVRIYADAGTNAGLASPHWLLAAVFSERLAQPLARLADGTRAVADGDFRGGNQWKVVTSSRC